jgi:hypothetical protein
VLLLLLVSQLLSLGLFKEIDNLRPVFCPAVGVDAEGAAPAALEEDKLEDEEEEVRVTAEGATGNTGVVAAAATFTGRGDATSVSFSPFCPPVLMRRPIPVALLAAEVNCRKNIQ